MDLIGRTIDAPTMKVTKALTTKPSDGAQDDDFLGPLGIGVELVLTALAASMVVSDIF